MSDAPSAPDGRRPIVDAHLHFYDSAVNRHSFLEAPDPGYEAFVGDYSALSRTYLPEAYLADAAACRAEGVVWHEYLSDDALVEARWAEGIAARAPMPMALVGLVDFLDPGLEARLDAYGALAHLTAVREHLVWHPSDPLKRFAKRPDLLMDAAWQRGLRHLEGRGLKCALEVFGPQLGDLLPVVHAHHGVGFTLPAMGWPLDLSPEGFARWRQDIAALACCENLCASISALECIFGLNWREDEVRPWVLALVEAFGPDRVMLGSHLPISRLSYGFAPLYDAYGRMLAGFSKDEQDLMFRRVAAGWFNPR